MADQRGQDRSGAGPADDRGYRRGDDDRARGGALDRERGRGHHGHHLHPPTLGGQPATHSGEPRNAAHAGYDNPQRNDRDRYHDRDRDRDRDERWRRGGAPRGDSRGRRDGGGVGVGRGGGGRDRGKAPPTARRGSGGGGGGVTSATGKAKREAVPPADPNDPEFDFSAMTFNPAKALAAKNLPVPVPKMPPLDNISKWYQLVMVDPKIKQAQKASKQAKIDAERKKVELIEKHPSRKPSGAPPSNLAAAAAATKGQKKPRGGVRNMNLLDRMEKEKDTGHFALLYRCVHEGAIVSVMIRKLKGVRGTCTATLRSGSGRLIAYDKHLNLVLGDVTERYSTMGIPELGPLPPAAELAKMSRRQRSRLHHPVLQMVDKTRHISQLFVRGDQVVRIGATLPKKPASDPAAAAAPTAAAAATAMTTAATAPAPEPASAPAKKLKRPSVPSDPNKGNAIPPAAAAMKHRDPRSGSAMLANRPGRST